MRNRFVLTVLMVVALLASTFTTAFAAGKTATLDEFVFIEGKGWVAIFSTEGTWKAPDLKDATINVDGKNFPLYCNFRDDGRIGCTASNLDAFVGMQALFFLDGQGYAGIVPPRQVHSPFLGECFEGQMETLKVIFWHDDDWRIGFIMYEAGAFSVHEAFQLLIGFVKGIHPDASDFELRKVTCS